MMQIDGRCHCGNISFELTTALAEADIAARACDCRFCRIHGTQNWSDPNGTAIIRVNDEAALQRYLFALKTAEFFICRTCGAYAGAVLSDADGTWSTLNLRLSALNNLSDAPVSFASEDLAGRIERRKRVWTPTRIVLGC